MCRQPCRARGFDEAFSTVAMVGDAAMSTGDSSPAQGRWGLGIELQWRLGIELQRSTEETPLLGKPRRRAKQRLSSYEKNSRHLRMRLTRGCRRRRLRRHSTGLLRRLGRHLRNSAISDMNAAAVDAGYTGRHLQMCGDEEWKYHSEERRRAWWRIALVLCFMLFCRGVDNVVCIFPSTNMKSHFVIHSSSYHMPVLSTCCCTLPIDVQGHNSVY